jgi:phosphomevalonate kinase
MTVRLEASGKVFLAGEFAVLDPGRPALVVGIDWKMHAVAEAGAHRVEIVHRPSGLLWDGGQAPAGLRFAARAALLAMSFCRKGGGVRISFEDDLSHGGRKLGLGGSAAACVLAVRAVCALADRRAADEEILALAVAAHWAEQGGSGSGADVAAAALGGILEVRSRIAWQSPQEVMALAADRIAASRLLDVRRVAVSPHLRLLLVDVGAPANTRSLVREVRAFARGNATRWQARAGEISSAAEKLRDALESADAQSALDAVCRAAAAMAALGEDAGAPIVTPELARACALASAAGAAAKPSGAGGGDCAVVIAFGDEARDRAEAALRPHFRVFRVAPA